MPPRAKHPGGRPVTTGRGTAGARQVLVRLSADEHGRIEAAAAARRMTIATLLRELALAATR